MAQTPAYPTAPVNSYVRPQVKKVVRLEEKTLRLRLVPYEEKYLPSMYRFMQDREAMKFTYVATSLENCHTRLARFESQREVLGFAPWCIFHNQTKEAIGWGGLAIDPEEPQWGIEVLYALSPHSWGKGLATELVDFALAFAFEVLQEARVSAFAMPHNFASIRVLEKCGFSSQRFVPELERIHYVANRVAAA